MASSCFSSSLSLSLPHRSIPSSSPFPPLRLLSSFFHPPRPRFPSSPLSLRSSSSSLPPKRFAFSPRAEFTTDEIDTLDVPVDDEDGSPLGSPQVSEAPDFGPGDDFPAGGDVPPEGPKLYVGNLPWSCNSQELAEVFQKVGSVEMVEVIYDRESGRSRGFGFVTMSSMDDAHAAKEKLDGADYGGRLLRVNFPQRNRGEPPLRPRFEGSNANKLFVGNLAWGVDDGTLQQVFSEYGNVLEARVVYDRDSGRSRGFGFVTMSSPAEVNEAINKLDGAEVEGRSLRVNQASDRPAPRGDFF